MWNQILNNILLKTSLTKLNVVQIFSYNKHSFLTTLANLQIPTGVCFW